MRILKCYLANDASGSFVTADDAARALGSVWTCASCGCVLYLLTGFGEKPWFEHDQQTVAEHVLMNCAHLDPKVKAEAGTTNCTVLSVGWMRRLCRLPGTARGVAIIIRA